MRQKEKLSKNKFLRNKKSFLFLLILCLGVGFAFLSSQLTITGNTSVSGNKWSVYFNNVQVTDGSVDASVVPTVTGTTTTSLNYTVSLDKPGDFYEFTVDAVNAGTIDAMIDSVTMTTLDTDVAKYISYTATYLDGTELAQNDVLEADDSTTYKVRVEYKKNIEATDLDEEDVNLSLTFGVNYVQSTIKPKPPESVFAKLVSDSALSDSSINFGAISSASNGRGLYVMNSTTDDTYPIYYYRGNVSNNNAKFAGFCWKIVRTTETGGTKLIYNGTPDADGQCVNTTGDATQLASTSAFNENWKSPAYNGYMYGTVYEWQKGTASTSHVYGNTFTYENGTYTLSDTHAGVDSTHHYTCFNTTGICSSLSYVYYVSGSNAYYITLTDGKSVEDALAEMQTNTTNSTIKTVVDNWFSNTFQTYFTNNSKDYNDYLEDTVWCNDRSMNTLGEDDTLINNGWKPNGGSISNKLMYSSYGRMQAGTPSLTCSNKNDSFTVTETANGNGALTYPLGLLTVDEMVLAGGQLYAVANENKDYYLYNEKTWWTMSPYYFSTQASEFLVSMSGPVDDSWIVNTSLGVRPSISLKLGVKIADGGDGSSATPYEFVVE